MPLGGLLQSFGIEYRSEPRAFFEIASDDVMNASLGCRTRRLSMDAATAHEHGGQVLAEIVEILRPAIDRRINADQPNHYDAIVIGAGPAGSPRRGARRERPSGARAREGKISALPYRRIADAVLVSPLNRLGLIEEMKSSAFVKKYSVSSSRRREKRRSRSISSSVTTTNVAQTWQVVRAEFDQMLLDNARAKGAEVREETPCKELIWDDGASSACARRTKTAH